MKYFLDTSALVKIYHNEEGSEKVLNLYNQENELGISELTQVEFVSTIEKKFREAIFDKEVGESLIEKFLDDVNQMYRMQRFSDLVISEAIDFLKKFGTTSSLRTLDSLQLGFFSVYSDSDSIFVTSDKALAGVAQNAGFKIIVP